MLLRKRGVGSCLLLTLMVLIAVHYMAATSSQKLNPLFWALDTVLPKKVENVTPPTTHIVLFQFKQSATPIQIKEITSKMLSLKKSCIHPSTRKPYIKSITGGKDNSIEDRQNGITHAFILQFHTNEDRNFYTEEDPVHLAFKDTVAAYVEKTIVVDFQEGVFTHV